VETAATDCKLLTSRKITVTGIVQGVGFRPFVYNLARSLGLAGSVRNSAGTVEIFIHGPEDAIETFLSRLKSQPPALAEIASVEIEEAGDGSAQGKAHEFVILDSGAGGDRQKSARMVPPDTATCGACLNELFDPANRRFFYPFINCTECGPRYTIIKDLPYDRATTTMSTFPMCSQCEAEYKDPANRRFHAQPNACFDCGPQIQFLKTSSASASDQTDDPRTSTRRALSEAVAMLREGKIIAIKGLGGFHLACDPTNEESVALLRKRKHRYAKPFAIMVPTIKHLSGICRFTDVELAALTSKKRPIVLLHMVSDSHEIPGPLAIVGAMPCIARDVNPGLDRIGVMLPYTPLHALLLSEFDGPLIMTSGNISDEPICMDNEEALVRLGEIADGFILHNRDIETRFDDSVLAVFENEPTLLRRSRGFAPQPLRLKQAARETVLALGGNLKNTFTLIDGNNAYISQHIGDLGSVECDEFVDGTLTKFYHLFDLKPQLLACDLHPDYVSTRTGERLARQMKLPLVRVQHHHAHIASCMAEHGIDQPVIGVAWDGIGYGADGTLWGGEFMLCDFKHYKRMASFAPVPLPGGEAGIKNPWRMAISYLMQPAIRDLPTVARMRQRYEEQFGSYTIGVIEQQIERRLNAPITTSSGRLFDAVSSLLSFCHEARFEGEAAMILEARARASRNASVLGAPFPEGTLRASSQGLGASLPEETLGATLQGLGPPASSRHISNESASPDLLYLIDSPSIIADICTASVAGTTPEDIAFDFHMTLADAATHICTRLAEHCGIDTVCLSGGVFQNRLLLELLINRLRDAGLRPFYQTNLPSNDGGLSVGQAMVALAQRRTEPCA
jgi:hydrogenase maturation protein HypF